MSMPTLTTARPEILERVDNAVRAAQDFLLARQSPEGYWAGELVADTTLESDYIMLMHLIDRVDPAKQEKLVHYIFQSQLPDGSWNIYVDGPGELNATLKAYFALRLAGRSPSEPALMAARTFIHRNGGLEEANSYTKMYFCIFGLYDWGKLPAIIPELMLLPRWFWFNLYEISAWTRAIVVPMMIICSHRPQKGLPVAISRQELGTGVAAPLRKKRSSKQAFWANFFRMVDWGLHTYHGAIFKPFRAASLNRAARWLLDRTDPPGGLGAIYPAMFNAIIALECLGFGAGHPRFEKAVREMKGLELADGNVMRVQPCLMPVWDTAWNLIALTESGILAGHEALHRAQEWLWKKQVFFLGDWAKKSPQKECGGWYFEFDNPFYPDTDDTSAVLWALHNLGADRDPVTRVRYEAGLRWMLSMQNKDGGFAAFDIGVTKEVLNYIPWADHNALLDPSTADITGRILECLGKLGFSPEDPRASRAVTYLKRTQEADGSWFGRWGVNYVYGTWQALRGLAAVGEERNRPYVRRAVAWLKSVQQSNGGWGELPLSYDDPSTKGRGPATPSQTAWGLMGLMAGGCGADDLAVVRAVEYLLANQEEEGGWRERHTTGTGFPGVFYLVYTMYRHYFPLMALAQYRNARMNHETTLRPLL